MTVQDLSPFQDSVTMAMPGRPWVATCGIFARVFSICGEKLFGGELSEKLRKNFSFGTEVTAGCFARRAGALWRNINMLRKILTAVAIGATVVLTSSFSASAAIVCQGNVCWHTHEAYDFPHEAGVVVHEDNWHWGPHEKFAFREHEGRGYWRGGKWVGW
jgi:hypothetical protein